MLSPDLINKFNQIILRKMSEYLNWHSDFIEASIIEELVNECGLSVKEAFAMVLAEVCELDVANDPEARLLYEFYFLEMLEVLDPSVYEKDLYLSQIKIPELKGDRWTFKMETYKPYEAFVYNDLKCLPDGRVLPQIGFFERSFAYPAVLENNREWMLITPNEIETMKEPIEVASGKVLTYGLGLGYYAYRVSEKENVSSVTVVEKDPEVIKLFRTYILPQFKHQEKLRIIEEDAFTYAKKQLAEENYDMVFVDIWHDPLDGVSLYQQMKALENLSPRSIYRYWIEETLRHYL